MKTLRLCFIATFTAFALSAHAAEQAPQAVPDAEPGSDETLTERLDRTDGVIKPPPVDTPMHVKPPPVHSDMPVLKPKDSPVQQTAPPLLDK